MLNDKLAVISSSFNTPNARPLPAAAIGTRGGPSAPARVGTPGLGAKMREETSRFLEQAQNRGSSDALAHFGLRAAA